jgi:hypothetical protein
LFVVELVAEDDFAGAPGEGRLDDQIFYVLDDLGQGRLFAAPPGGDRGHGQFFPEQVTRDTRQEARQGGGFEQAAAQGVGHQHPAGTRR